MHRDRSVVWAWTTILLVVAALFLPACASRDQSLANQAFRAIERMKYEVAERQLKEALEINAQNPYVVLNLGAVYQRTGRTEDARALFEKVIAMNAQEVPQRVSKGSEHLTLRQIAEKNLTILGPKR